MTLSRRQFVTRSAAIAAATQLPGLARAQSGLDADVIVIGAGLSGLETALTLEENGLKVLLLEGRKRVGGRIETLKQIPGHPEAGGNTIAAAYGRMIAAGQKYGVEIVNLTSRIFANRDTQGLYIDGKHVPLDDWAKHPSNPFQGDARGIPPWTWSDTLLRKNQPFPDLENWTDPKHAEFDISVYDYLRRLGATDEQIHLGYDTNIAYGNSARDVSLLTLMFAEYWQQVNRGALSAFSRSALAPATGSTAPSAGAPAGASTAPAAAPLIVGMYKGGNINLPIAMANKLKGPMLLGQRVIAIDTYTDGGSVHCEDGKRYRAKAVVSSMPYTTLRHVRINPAPPPQQNTAIYSLGTIPITQFHIVPKKPFWKNDGLSASMWTDSAMGMCLAQRFSDKDEITSLAVWCRGLAAQYVDRLGIEGGKRMIISQFEKMRPAAKGLLEIAAVKSWGNDPFAAGDWAIFEPGQVTSFVKHLAKQHQRLYFCGEHTSVGSRGMEGAMESAERVSLEVLEALG
jgi:monoamine oxidase